MMKVQELKKVKRGSVESSEEELESGEEEEGDIICEHFYGAEAPPAMPSPDKEFAWDFFNPFDEVRTGIVSSFNDSSQEELRAVREKEGIPDLEEDGVRDMSERKAENVTNADDGVEESKNKNTDLSINGDDHDANISQGEKNSFRIIKTPTATNERELLEDLKDVEDHFLRAYESGLDVCRVLEANRVQLQSGLEELKESSNKLIRSITWSRYPLSHSSYCKSLVSCSSRSSSTWTELKIDMYDDYGGMESGSHSLILGRLYAWEKKLYEKVKVLKHNSIIDPKTGTVS
ncbi:protein ALTERED PHOSPHATE STARVATION RESPONSE 1-like [Hibiscus syriacus]|uniref:protein ALTERED PHOSPHATE STARVATION RESPONSE 1-like n=1 Tax=Hibiscus syriacus TaxID=106335 RepID=UPI001921717C|nr:protein ALTERED PHOSPHATE STARVATION RESPONSE 1-like [Hibiscus syriacus]